jgi:endonuclease YncB( thermonuclease family)
MASRKGIEPLTPGLGNLCSILLSYRDQNAPRWTNASEAGKAFSMNLRVAHRIRQRLGRFGVRAGVWLGLAGQTLGFASPCLAGCGMPAGAVRIAAVDERLNVALVDGRLIRLGGLDAPEPARGDPETVTAARSFLAARLVGREAELDLLASGTDRWGRVVADLSAAETPGGPSESIVLALLAAGYARVRPEFETRNCAAARLAVEDGARRAGLGIWRDREYAVIPSSDLPALRRRVGQFVVLEGRVRRVGFGRSRLYLDLIPQAGPTIVVVRKLESAFARAGHPIAALAGQTIRARGALDDRFGLRLEVNEPAMIEFLRRSDAPAADKPRP